MTEAVYDCIVITLGLITFLIIAIYYNHESKIFIMAITIIAILTMISIL